MFVDNLFSPVNILEKGMQATVLRNEVIQNNIANADTPGFKRSTVHFETFLNNAIDNAKSTGVLNLDNVQPVIFQQSFNYRLDENNVDIETEMVNLYQNSARYDMLVSSVNNQYKKINAVLSAK